MSVDTLLSRLQGVKRTGDETWLARCPAHDDRSPSLAVRELADGTLLAHCFAGCSIGEVLAAVGLEVGDLYPLPLAHRLRPLAGPRFPARDVLEAIGKEAAIVMICAQALKHGRTLPPADQQRLGVAVGRLTEAVDVARG